ncbi:protein FAM183A isoform X1 [Perca fluviatilis]|uniref:protein FAM183A isoform X1 n=1 Tax=Perca fluviatilis TaxID=8168 RepID=UPI001965A929|nr:protein FAM183A isoform X1 [Perca fluviatilis]
MAGKEKLDLVHQNAIHVETILKEQRQQKLHTEFSINPHRKLHVLPDKPMSRKPKEDVAGSSDFIKAFHRARQEPTKKYAFPQTESQEIGWVSTPLVRKTIHENSQRAGNQGGTIPSNRSDKRFNFFRFSSDVTKHQESALRLSH